ncbi:hypothetical protein [Streptomyces kronopolitis]|uniref:hypothetical protein n=1 Tax=Streptomyces kronopolitis TaxID=1612435 RepID=UPI003D958A99
MTEQTTEPQADAAAPGTCRFPGCEEPREQATTPGRPPAYCANPDHNRTTAYKRRMELQQQENQAAAQANPADQLEGRPVALSERRTRDLLPSAQALAERLTVTFTELSAQLATLSDPGAAAAQIETVQAEAAQKVANAEAARATAVREATEAGELQAEAEAAAEDATGTAKKATEAARQAQHEAETARGAAAVDRATAEQIRQDTPVRIATLQDEARRQIQQAQKEAATHVEAIKAEAAEEVKQARATAEETTRRQVEAVRAEAAEEIKKTRETAEEEVTRQVEAARTKADAEVKRVEKRAEDAVKKAEAAKATAISDAEGMRKERDTAQSTASTATSRAEFLEDQHRRLTEQHDKDREDWRSELANARKSGEAQAQLVNNEREEARKARGEADQLRRELAELRRQLTQPPADAQQADPAPQATTDEPGRTKRKR